MGEINFGAIEKKWQKKWEEAGIFAVNENQKKKKYYVLEMFPYPSGSGLHMGHAFNYSIGDIRARLKRMQGFNVLYPMGYDSFGLPAENAAIKEKIHPKKYTESAIKNFIIQQKGLGLSYDWDKILKTSSPEYYKWNQYFFLKFLEKGLIYRKKSSVNFCTKCDTVLANEQVHNGMCWRHQDMQVEIKQLEQWFIKTTNYAEELLQEVDKLEWPERIKIMQKNWIGKSEGTEIIFKINEKPWKIFTTRPDTLFGVTFLVISAQHPELMQIVTKENKKEVENFLKLLKSTKQEEMDKMAKEGVFTGTYAIHPFTNEKIPIYAGNFVLAEYGSGMVMAVPAHDQRDFEFAKKYRLPIKVVVSTEKKAKEDKMDEAYEGAGKLINSEGFDDLFSEEAKVHITKALEFKKLGKKTTQYKLRDWLISRQRYWGTPIPMIYCEKCGVVPVPEKDLPIVLPEKVKFEKGNPLASNVRFVNTTCPKCKGKARRETDTMDTFFDSSWYFLRYTDNENKKEPFEKQKAEYWMPVDQYIGGAEHACMHLIYARFFTKALRDLGFLRINEPFIRLFNQGMLYKEGQVMSKSKGNVVLPEEVSKRYGIDTARFFLISIASPDKDIEWSDQGIEGSSRFIKKVMNYFENFKIGKSTEKTKHHINKAIKIITNDLENFRYNFAAIMLRELFENLENEISKQDAENLIKLLSPICPHIAEEFWEKMGGKGFVSLAKWPEYDESKIDKKLEEEEKVFEETIQDINNILRMVREKRGKEAEKIYLYVIPKEIEVYDLDVLKKRIGRDVNVFSVSDKSKYDPEGKAKKAKPGKPGIYVE